MKEDILKRYEKIEKDFFRNIKGGLDSIESAYLNSLPRELVERIVADLAANTRDLKVILQNMKNSGADRRKIGIKEKIVGEISEMVGNPKFKRSFKNYLPKLKSLKTKLKPFC